MMNKLFNKKVALPALTFCLKYKHHIFMFPGWRLLLLGLMLIVTAAASTGCATAKYKFAKKDTPSAILLNIPFKQPPVEGLLHTVIVYKGSGSWKREAYWDEYIISLVNQGALPLAINTATLVDFQDNHNAAGSNPWRLEKQSKTWWQNIKSSEAGRLVKIGAGMGAAYMAAYATFGAVFATGSGSAAVAGAGFVAAGIAFTALPVYAVISVFSNISARHKIEAEFTRRRLKLPVNLTPGQVVQGSVFFPISPGPKRFILECQTSDETREVNLDLAPLAGLHLNKETTGKPAASSMEQGK
jgi:hypothetical protein